VVVREDEGVGLDIEALGRLAALPADRIRTEDPDVLDHLRAANGLERREDLAGEDRPAEGPARAVRPAEGRVVIAEEGIESVLLEHPQVKECGVVGVADDERGHIVKAFIVLQPGAEPSEENLHWLRDVQERLSALEGTEALIEDFGMSSGRPVRSF